MPPERHAPRSDEADPERAAAWLVHDVPALVPSDPWREAPPTFCAGALKSRGERADVEDVTDLLPPPLSGSPAEIDTFLAANWSRTNEARHHLHHARLSVRHVAGQREVGRGRDRHWDGTYEEAMETLAARLDGGDWRATEATRTIERVRSAVAAVSALREEARPYEAEHAERRWRRYFLVTNDNGHVHRGMDCSTCYETTQYAWLPSLSGCDEAEMVAEWGEKACTVCFPDAPTMRGFGDGTSGYARRTAEEQAARDAEKAAKAAEKAAKAITDLDGSPLRDGNGLVLRTKVAARNALSWEIESAVGYGRRSAEDEATIARLTAALEAAGIDTAPVIARATKKGQAWAR